MMTDDADRRRLVREAMARKTSITTGNKPKTLPYVLVDELEGKPYPPRQWFVPDWMPDRNVTSLYGSGGTGKSLLAMQLCTAGATGGEWLGMPLARRKCFYLSCEDDEDELYRRQVDINSRTGLNFGDFDGHYGWLARPGDENGLMEFDRGGRGKPTKLAKDILSQCRDEGFQFLVVDTAADTFTGNEIVRTEVRQYVAYLRKIAMEINGCVLLLAHPSVAGMKDHGYSGSTAWQGSVRSLLTFEHGSGDGEDVVDTDRRVLTRKKANYAKAGHELGVRYNAGIFEAETRAGQVNPQQDFLDQDIFKTGLLKLLDRGLCPSASRNREEYAPKLMKRTLARDFGAINVGRLERAMRGLLEAGEVGVQRHWKGASPLTPTGYDLTKWRKGDET